LQASRTVSAPPTHLRRHSNLTKLITPPSRPRSSLASPPLKPHAPKLIPSTRVTPSSSTRVPMSQTPQFEDTIADHQPSNTPPLPCNSTSHASTHDPTHLHRATIATTDPHHTTMTATMERLRSCCISQTTSAKQHSHECHLLPYTSKHLLHSLSQPEAFNLLSPPHKHRAPPPKTMTLSTLHIHHASKSAASTSKWCWDENSYNRRGENKLLVDAKDRVQPEAASALVPVKETSNLVENGSNHVGRGISSVPIGGEFKDLQPVASREPLSMMQQPPKPPLTPLKHNQTTIDAIKTHPNHHWRR